MGRTTGIEWTDATWNPWRGCRKVSPGCAHCYMYREQERYGREPREVVRAAPGTFDAPLHWQRMHDEGEKHDYSHDDRLRPPKLVFTCSWSDFFIEEADAWRGDAWGIIRRTPALTYQILTKRPERIAGHLPGYWDEIQHRVWMGVSVESQTYMKRLETLMQAVGLETLCFLSVEPILSQVNLWPDLLPDWVIAGGESGPGARHARSSWVRSLLADCKLHDVPFFLKQLGGWPDPKAHDKAVLDGRRWTEMPSPGSKGVRT